MLFYVLLNTFSQMKFTFIPFLLRACTNSGLFVSFSSPHFQSWPPFSFSSSFSLCSAKECMNERCVCVCMGGLGGWGWWGVELRGKSLFNVIISHPAGKALLDDDRVFHLVRPMDELDEIKSKRGSIKDKSMTKAITEIYLTRLLSVKVKKKNHKK